MTTKFKVRPWLTWTFFVVYISGAAYLIYFYAAKGIS